MRIEVELTRPLEAIVADADTGGVAVLVRKAGVPVGFWMESLDGRHGLSVEELARRIQRRVGDNLLYAALNDQFARSAPARVSEPARPLSLTIAICTKDRPVWLTRLLHSLAAVIGNAAADDRIEILVVDNASSNDETRLAAGAFDSVRYTYEPVPGLDFARNRALAEANGELLAFLDDDVVVDHGWLDGLRAAFRDHPDAGGFSGLVLPLELETEAQLLFEQRGGFGRGFRRICHRNGCGADPRFPLNAGQIGTGANMAFRRDLLRALGGFDEALDTGPPLPGGGDLDMFYRVIRAGFDLIYDPAYLVFHHHRRDIAALRRQLHSWGTGPMAMLAKVYAAEPTQRAHVRSLVGWWFADQSRRLGSSLVRRKLPSTLVLAELSGAVQGLFGEYARSQKRVEQRKQRYA